MEFKEEENRVPVNARVTITGNQFFKEKWMSECQKMLDDSAAYIARLKSSKALDDSNFQTGGSAGVPVRQISAIKLTEEADKILQLYNHNKEREDHEIEVEIDRDVKNTLDNI